MGWIDLKAFEVAYQALHNSAVQVTDGHKRSGTKCREFLKINN